MNFKNNKSPEGRVYFENDLDEGYHLFAANFHNGLGKNHTTRITGGINQNSLRIYSSSRLISIYLINSDHFQYYHYFKRV